MDELKCPICGRQMKYAMTIEHETKFGRDGFLEYKCEDGHERVLVKINFDPIFALCTFVYLGDGCYVVLRDNTSCEKAIQRMRREYESSIETHV